MNFIEIKQNFIIKTREKSKIFLIVSPSIFSFLAHSKILFLFKKMKSLPNYIKESLVARHAKPWRDCKPAEKINARNGLLLAAHLDALFDKFLITFDEDWKIKIAPHLESECKRIGITPEMMVKYEKLKKQDQAEVQNFLKEHRRRFNEKQKS